MCNIGKHIKRLKNFFAEFRNCKSKRGLKLYYDNEDEMSNERKIYYENNKDKLLQKQTDRFIHFKELARTYVELGNRVKALEEKTKNLFFFIKSKHSKSIKMV